MAFDAPTAKVIGVVIGSSLTGLLAFFNNKAQFRRQKDLELQNAARAKLEELHGAIETFREEFTTAMLKFVSILQPSNQTLKGAAETKVNVLRSLSKVEMLTNLYAPDLYRSVVALRDIMQEDSNERSRILSIEPALSLPSPNQSNIDCVLLSRRTLEIINNHCDDLQTQLAIIAKKHSVS